MSNTTFGLNKNHSEKFTTLTGLQCTKSNLLSYILSYHQGLRKDEMCSWCSSAQLLSFFHLPTGPGSSRAILHTDDAACGIGWGGGTGPAPRAWRAAGEECAGEAGSAACAVQGRRQEEIRAMSEVEESLPLIFKWVLDESSRKMSLDISPVVAWWREEINFICQRCQDCQQECHKMMVRSINYKVRARYHLIRYRLKWFFCYL